MMEQFDMYCKRYDEALGWIQRGRFEGYELGQKNGYDLGQKKGYDLGSDSKEQEIIMNMLDNDMTLDTISKATKLSKEKIKKIIKSNKQRNLN